MEKGMSVIGTFLLAGATAVKWKRKIEECYAPAAIILTILLYISGLYFTFLPGIIAYYCLIGIAAVYLIYAVLKKRSDFLCSVFTVGGFYLLISILFFAWYSMGRGIDHSDDYYFWNLRVKNYVYFGKIIRGVPNTELGDHPPFTSLWNYLAVMTWSGEVSQGICLWAQNVLLISFFAPLFTLIRRTHKWGETLLTSVIFFLIPTIVCDAYHSLVTDLLVGASFLFCFFQYWKKTKTNDRFSSVCFILGMYALVMTKRAGAIFAVIVLFVCMQDGANTRKKNMRFMLSGAVLLSAVALFLWSALSQPFYILCGGFWLSVLSVWLIHLLSFGRSERWGRIFFLVLAFTGLCAAAMGLRIIYDRDLAFFNHTWGQITVFPTPSLLECGVDLIVIILLLLWKNRSSEGGFPLEDTLWAVIWYVISAIGYFELMWFLEIVTIGPSNGGVGGLSVRYFIPFLFPLYGAILILLFRQSEKEMIAFLLGLVLVVHVYSDTPETLQNLREKAPTREFYEFEKNGITLSPQDHVFLIDEHDDYVYTDRAFYNYICPATSQFGQGYNYLIENASAVNGMTMDEFQSQLEEGDYNYVYIQLIDEKTRQEYENLFESKDSIGNGRLYSVMRTETGIYLKWLKHD